MKLPIPVIHLKLLKIPWAVPDNLLKTTKNTRSTPDYLRTKYLKTKCLRTKYLKLYKKKENYKELVIH